MLRKITSLTGFLSFIITLITSVILYIVPQGRVAYWADWTFWGLSKEQWGDIHITVGTLFVVALLVHIWLNWRPLLVCMKNRAREFSIKTAPVVISLAITLFVTVGTLLGLPPMQQILEFSVSIKDSAMETYGNPPYGHAEQSSLRKFCGYLGFEVEEALVALRKAGYSVDAEAKAEIREIARAKGVSPQQVYNDLRTALASDPFAAMPPSPPEGTGKLKFSELCATYGLPVDEAIAKLERLGVHIGADTILKDAGKENNMTPQEIYKALRSE